MKIDHVLNVRTSTLLKTKVCRLGPIIVSISNILTLMYSLFGPTHDTSTLHSIQYSQHSLNLIIFHTISFECNTSPIMDFDTMLEHQLF